MIFVRKQPGSIVKSMSENDSAYSTVDHLNMINAYNTLMSKHRRNLSTINRIINLPNASDEYKITNLKKYMKKYMDKFKALYGDYTGG